MAAMMMVVMAMVMPTAASPVALQVPTLALAKLGATADAGTAVTTHIRAGA
jgi:hypothetical protein